VGESPADDIKAYLDGATFPVSKDELIKVSERNGAPEEVLERLRLIDTEQFSDPEAVRAALGNSSRRE